MEQISKCHSAITVIKSYFSTNLWPHRFCGTLTILKGLSFLCTGTEEVRGQQFRRLKLSTTLDKKKTKQKKQKNKVVHKSAASSRTIIWTKFARLTKVRSHSHIGWYKNQSLNIDMLHILNHKYCLITSFL